MASRLTPVPDAPALLLEPAPRGVRTLLVADLHIGLGANQDRPAGPPEASGPSLAARLVELAHAQKARRVVIAGDVKHPIVGTPPGLRSVLFDFFSALLSEGIGTDVVLGNHDVGLVRHLPREVTVHPATGFVLEQVGIFHGHCWPSNRVLGASRLVVGHLHPGFRLAPSPDDPQGKRRCWVRLELPPAAPRVRRRRRHSAVRASELIVLSQGVARAYLLDGTDLGLLTLPRPTVRARGVSGAPPAR
jgi:metallophosphoesterase superfamily enzyme